MHVFMNRPLLSCPQCQHETTLLAADIQQLMLEIHNRPRWSTSMLSFLSSPWWIREGNRSTICGRTSLTKQMSGFIGLLADNFV